MNEIDLHVHRKLSMSVTRDEAGRLVVGELVPNELDYTVTVVPLEGTQIPFANVPQFRVIEKS